MRIRRIISTVSVLLIAWCQAVELHAAQLFVGDFGVGDIAETFDLPMNTPPIFTAQDTPLRLDAVTYTSLNGTLNHTWNGGGLITTGGGVISNQVDGGTIVIQFDTTQDRVGLDFGSSLNWTAEASFFSVVGLLGTVSQGENGRRSGFAGWEATGLIDRIEVVDVANIYGGTLVIDNLRLAQSPRLPEPATSALLAIGLIGAGFARRRTH